MADIKVGTRVKGTEEFSKNEEGTIVGILGADDEGKERVWPFIIKWDNTAKFGPGAPIPDLGVSGHLHSADEFEVVE